MPRRVLLVRHCQSEANAKGLIEGRGDSPLSDEGRRQADVVAAFIAAQSLGEARLIASSQARAIATATAIGAACGWETAAHDHRIREGELGWMEERTYEDVRRHMIERGATRFDDGAHGGEAEAAVAERFWEALDEAIAASEAERALVMVSHGYAIQALLRRLDTASTIPRLIANGDVVELWLEDGALAEPPRHFPLAAGHAAAG
jgi:probable phosphoglycerate mutase